VTLNLECGVLTQTPHHFGYNKLKRIQWTNCHSIFFNVSYEENEYRFFNKKCNHLNIHLLSGLLIEHFGRNS
jgi:hypothetical protein